MKDELVTTRTFLEDMNFLHRIANVTLTCTTRISELKTSNAGKEMEQSKAKNVS